MGVTARKKAYDLLNLRRQIDRKILGNKSWSIVDNLKFKIKLLIALRSLKPFITLSDRSIYGLLNNEIHKIVSKYGLLKEVGVIELDTVNRLTLHPEWFIDLKKYDEELRREGSILIIQGSYADGGITNYSDIDLVILYEPYNKKVLKIKKEIEIFLLKVDPLQHHGVFMIDKKTFNFYWQMDLPIEVLMKAKVFSAKSEVINISKRIDENLSSIAAVNSTLNTILDFCNSDFETIGLWRWKFFLSQLMLLPTLVLATNGNYVYKKESFALAQKLYSEKAWYCIEKATAIRNRWIDPSLLKKYLNSRQNVTEDVTKEAFMADEFDEISVKQDTDFYKSLRLFVHETNNIKKYFY